MLSRLNPASCVITVPPVKTAISCNINFRNSPKPGARTATAFTIPLNLFKINVAKASFSTSSAIINNGRLVFVICSKIGNRSCWTNVIRLSVNKIYGLSYETSILSVLVIKYGEIKPFSNFIPSVISNSVIIPLPSSKEITPSFPTFANASAIKEPITSSLPAEIEATCWIAWISSTGWAYSLIWVTKYWVAFSIPNFIEIGFAPAATFFKPSLTIAYAKTVAVVVPSPATSFVFDAAWRINETPVFSMWSSNLISLAIVTPSFTIWGEP